MKKKIVLLRFSYWYGVFADVVSAIAMLSPKIGGSIYGRENFNPGLDYKYAMGMGASLMIGWTILLIWADRKPVERRGVIGLTLFVILGILITNIYAVVSGFIAVEKMIPTWIAQGFIAILYSFTYFSTKNMINN